jgi:hypothetical protein
MIIWSDEILDLVESSLIADRVVINIGTTEYLITGIENSQNIGWYEIRFSTDYDYHSTITTQYLKDNLPREEMVMLQEEGKSYPINSIFVTLEGKVVLKCEDPKSEYWEELERWKIEQDNIKINITNITNFLRDELEKLEQ